MDLGINKRMLTSHSEIKHLPTQALAEQETGAFLHLHTPSRHRLRLLSLHGKNYTRKCVPHRPVGSQLTSLVTNRWRGKPGCYLREDPPYGNMRSREQCMHSAIRANWCGAEEEEECQSFGGQDISGSPNQLPRNSPRRTRIAAGVGEG